MLEVIGDKKYQDAAEGTINSKLDNMIRSIGAHAEGLIIYHMIDEMKKYVESGRKFVLLIDVSEFPLIVSFLGDVSDVQAADIKQAVMERMKKLDVSHRDFSKVDDITVLLINNRVPLTIMHSVNIK